VSAAAKPSKVDQRRAKPQGKRVDIRDAHEQIAQRYPMALAELSR
jgi:hypothetical protein